MITSTQSSIKSGEKLPKAAILGLNRTGLAFAKLLRGINRPVNATLATVFTVTGWDSTNSSSNDRDNDKVSSGDLDNSAADPATAVADADLIILSLNVTITQQVLLQIAKRLKPGAVVLDLSPLKLPALNAMRATFPRDAQGNATAYMVGARLVPGSMALSDPTADPITGGLLILAPALDCPTDAVGLIADLAHMLEISVQYSDPDEHDGLAAAMDTLPLLLQTVLFRSLKNSFAWDDMRRFGKSEFVEATVALTPGAEKGAITALALELGARSAATRAALLARLDALRDEIDAARTMLRSADDLGISEYYEGAIKDRATWATTRTRRPVLVEHPTGLEPSYRMFGGLLSRFRGKAKE